MNKKSSTVSKWRIWTLYFSLFGLLGALLLRGGQLYLQEVESYFEYGNKRSIKTVNVPASKGIITDRNGEVLAVTTVLYSLIVDLNLLQIKTKDSKQQIRFTKKRIDEFKAKIGQLAKIIDRQTDWIERKVFLQDLKRTQIYLKKDLQPEQVNALNDLKIPALVFERKLKRYYPYGEVLAHIVGFSDYVNVGQSGVEQYFDKYLRGQNGKFWLRRDRVGDVTAYVAGDNKFEKGKDLNLTIDVNIQSIAYFALQQALNRYKAKSGTVVVLKAKTGGVLAMASLPSFNTNDYAQRIGEKLSNIAVQELYEPGSVVKPFLVLAGLESNVISSNTKLYLGKKRPKHQIKIANSVFKDSVSLNEDTISIKKMLHKSSNVGAIRLGQKLTDKILLDTYKNVGFGVPVDIKLYGGHIKGTVPKKLTAISRASISIGYGLNATVMQMARAYSVLANEGKLLKTRITMNEKISSKQVASTRNIKQINQWLISVTSRDGTAPLAKVDGFNVIGKTGTTLVSLGKKGYAKNKYTSAFVGFAPAKNPEIVVAVLIHEPSGKKYYGGEVAAPVFAKVVSESLNHMGVRSSKQKSLTSRLLEMKS